MASSTISKRETNFAAGLVTWGIASYYPLKVITERFGGKASMIVAQLAGEFLVQLLNKADELIHHPKIRYFLSQVGIGLTQLTDWETKSDSEKGIFQHLNEKRLRFAQGINSVLALLSTLPVTFALSDLAMRTGEMSYFFLIAPVNSSILLISEILNRTIRNRRVLSQYSTEDRNKVVKQLTQETRFLKRLFEKYPSLAIALLDFSHNLPAYYAYLGTLTSFPVLTLINQVSRLPLEMNEALSGLIFEGASGLFGGLKGAKTDSYQTFLRLVSLMETITRQES